MPDLLALLRLLLPRDPLEFWVALFMWCAIIVMFIGGLLLRRSNARLHEENEARRRSRQAEAQAAEQAVDALSGRPSAPAPERTDTDTPT